MSQLTLMKELGDLVHRVHMVAEKEFEGENPDFQIFESTLLLQMANKLLTIVYNSGDDSVQDALAAPIDEIGRLARSMQQGQNGF